MLRKFAVVLTGIMLLAAALPAQNDKETPAKPKVKPPVLKDRSKEIARKTKPYKIVSVDADGGTIKVEDAEGNPSTLKITESTTILGNLGGKKNDGIKDERLKPGKTLRVNMQGSTVKEVYLPRLSHVKDKGRTKKPRKTKTKAKEDDKATKEVDKKEEKKTEEKKKKGKTKAKAKDDDEKQPEEKTKTKVKEKAKAKAKAKAKDDDEKEPEEKAKTKAKAKAKAKEKAKEKIEEKVKEKEKKVEDK